MKKNLIYIVIIIGLFLMIGCSNKEVDIDKTSDLKLDTVKVSVGIVPEATFVKSVGGDLVDVEIMIPPGYSPANYQPTPKQMAELSKSRIYFSTGVPTEESNIIPMIEGLDENIKIVHLDERVRNVYPDRSFDEEHKHNHEHDSCEHAHEGRDPHIWLSPKRVKVMIYEIKDELIKLNPDNKKIYEKNAIDYISKLDEVDKEIKLTLDNVSKQSFIIYHPSFGYFADDYDLNMIAIEEDGKKTTAKRLQEIIDFAKKNNIKFVFYQQEFDSKQADTIAKEIGGESVQVSPLSPDYIKNLKHISHTFNEVLK
ncbi:MAG: zinc ABC transporter substrate-binding protein [Tepidibacter sp.]|uniref:metal ABC transporter solute-binding protein, Zn/Mn family n=1 Tax=Tepidibacter sp. TaxID=2529387 RepID=UPI0025D3D362|nr:zinc ABC transporter substrate-binding protein [Tepidibacter sp.]MCT4509341.1 zinc ABC transporter substrate-binding protein [Tepidibacter sp.]